MAEDPQRLGLRRPHQLHDAADGCGHINKCPHRGVVAGPSPILASAHLGVAVLVLLEDGEFLWTDSVRSPVGPQERAS